jgi:tetratricopeptide (TPR) repeat protein
MRFWLAFLSWMLLAAPGARADQTDPRLDILFDQLQQVAETGEARAIEAEIWRIWIASGDPELDARMAEGMGAMGARDYPHALAEFSAIVDAAPDFAEGWNKRATLYWLMGDYQASIEDIDRTLALEPRHFGALSGLSMIRDALGEPREALEAFDRALAVYPNMAGADLRRALLESKLGEPI